MISDIKTEQVFATPLPVEPLQLSPSPEIEIQDSTSVAVLETEYDDQDYNQQDLDYETSDDNHGWYFNLIWKMNV